VELEPPHPREPPPTPALQIPRAEEEGAGRRDRREEAAADRAIPAAASWRREGDAGPGRGGAGGSSDGAAGEVVAAGADRGGQGREATRAQNRPRRAGRRRCGRAWIRRRSGWRRRIEEDARRGQRRPGRSRGRGGRE